MRFFASEAFWGSIFSCSFGNMCDQVFFRRFESLFLVICRRPMYTRHAKRLRDRADVFRYPPYDWRGCGRCLGPIHPRRCVPGCRIDRWIWWRKSVRYWAIRVGPSRRDVIGDFPGTWSVRINRIHWNFPNLCRLNESVKISFFIAVVERWSMNKSKAGIHCGSWNSVCNYSWYAQ